MGDPSTPPVGSEVGVRYGGSVVIAFVVEDRGVFGGEHIVRVRVGDRDDPEAPDFEIPASELVPVPAAA